MRSFHPLKVVAKRNETADSVRIALDVPEPLRETFEFLPGQHLPVMVEDGDRSLRRTYSICTPPGRWPLELGIRVQPGGAFSGFAAQGLQVGDTLAAMPPAGRFHASPDPGAARHYAAFAAGSGITPILSIVTALLETEPGSHVSLFYGNRRQATTMFIDDLYALKNRFPERLVLHFLFSREEQEFPVAVGRLDADKVRELWQAWCLHPVPDEAFVCGPDTMIEDVCTTLVDLGMPPAAIHSERFGLPRSKPRSDEPQTGRNSALVTVIMDGQRKSFEMEASDPNIVDAAAGHGIDLPFSCKGGVCATCRCRIVDGEVTMAANYGLEPWEVEKGYILACQSRPVGAELTLDYDTT
jgi:ring-1,2-phenylacetyl-CoA epoxidase subunit PaaE